MACGVGEGAVASPVAGRQGGWPLQRRGRSGQRHTGSHGKDFCLRRSKQQGSTAGRSEHSCATASAAGMAATDEPAALDAHGCSGRQAVVCGDGAAARRRRRSLAPSRQRGSSTWWRQHRLAAHTEQADARRPGVVLCSPMAAALVPLRGWHRRCSPWTCAPRLSSLQKYVPIDLRARKTRAIRRRLTKAQVGVCHSFALAGVSQSVKSVRGAGGWQPGAL